MGLSKYFDVEGVDIKPQPHYPFTFHCADALDFDLSGYDFIWASPPCQAYSISRNNGCHKDAPELIGRVREKLLMAGVPYTIENVVGAPLVNAITLCGASFGLGVCGFDLNRHRKFESSHLLLAPQCTHRRGQTIGVYGSGTNSWHRNLFGRCVTVAEMREAMGIDWMSHKELTQAIPPAYSEFLGKQMLAIIECTREAAA